MPRLIARKPTGTIEVDTLTTLRGVPPEAWDYRLGTYTALEWVLERYKERKPKDPTIRERFNTYRFADYKEHVVDLLRRVCTVSVETMAIVREMMASVKPVSWSVWRGTEGACGGAGGVPHTRRGEPLPYYFSRSVNWRAMPVHACAPKLVHPCAPTAAIIDSLKTPASAIVLVCTLAQWHSSPPPLLRPALLSRLSWSRLFRGPDPSYPRHRPPYIPAPRHRRSDRGY